MISTYIIRCENIFMDMAIVLQTYNTTPWDWFYFRGHFYTLAKGHDNVIMRPSKLIQRLYWTYFSMVTNLQVSCKDICDQALNQVLSQLSSYMCASFYTLNFTTLRVVTFWSVKSLSLWLGLPLWGGLDLSLNQSLVDHETLSCRTSCKVFHPLISLIP